jgi:hypothetical protein
MSIHYLQLPGKMKKITISVLMVRKDKVGRIVGNINCVNDVCFEGVTT